MNILIIEDDDNKRQQLVAFLNESTSGHAIVETRSYQGGLKEILRTHYDLIFLDMTMPTFDKSPSEPGGRIRPFAGKEILEQLRHRGIHRNVFVFTQFDLLGEGEQQVTLSELDHDLRKKFIESYRGIVYYNTAQSEWKSKVREAIDLIEGLKQ